MVPSAMKGPDREWDSEWAGKWAPSIMREGTQMADNITVVALTVPSVGTCHAWQCVLLSGHVVVLC